MDSVANSKPRGFRKKPLLMMLAVFVVGVGFAIALASSVGKLEELAGEAAKAGLEVGLVAVAAALLSFVADDYKGAEEKRRFREDFLKEILKRVTTSYNKTKGARRMVRARGLIPASSKPTDIRLEAYDECVAELNRAQLKFEAVKRDLETSSVRSDEWKKRFAEAMEKHLGHIIEEYEVIRRRPGEGEKTLSLADLKEFTAFVDPDDKRGFKTYSDPHRKTHDAINRELRLLNSGHTIKDASERTRRKMDADEELAAWYARWQLYDKAAEARKEKRKLL